MTLRGLVLAFLATALMVPPAGAFDRVPLLDDPTGDWDPPAPDPGLAGPAEADLLAAWIDFEGPSTINFTLQVARIRVGQPLGYDLVFRREHPVQFSPDHPPWIDLRASTDKEGRAFFGLYTGNDGEALDDFSHGGYGYLGSNPVTGRTTPGTPGTITWSLPLAGHGLLPDSRIGGFFARARVPVAASPDNRAQSPTISDDMAGSGVSYDVGRPALQPLPTFEPPSRPPDFLDDEEGNGGALDLQAVWVDFTDGTVNHTLRVGNLGAEALGECSWLAQFQGRVWSSMAVDAQRDPHNGAAAILRRSFDSVQKGPYFFSGGINPVPRTDYVPVSGIEGSPGFVRLSQPTALWGDTRNHSLAGMQVLYSAQCVGGGPIDEIQSPLAATETPASSVAWAFGAWAVALGRRRRA